MRRFRFYCLSTFAGMVLAACASKTPPRVDAIGSVQGQQSIVTPETEAQEAPTEPGAPIWQATADGAGLQHLASGFVCPAEYEAFLLTGDEIFPGLGHGHDVACIFRAAEGGIVRLHLTNFGRDVPASAHLKGVQTQIAQAEQILANAPLPPLTGDAVPDNSAAYQIAARSALRPDIPVNTAVWIKPVGKWHVKARATYEADRSVQIGRLVSGLLAAAARDIDQPTEYIPPQR